MMRAMRLWLYRLILLAMWVLGFRLIWIWASAKIDGERTAAVFILAGGYLAAVATVALAEEVVEALSASRPSRLLQIHGPPPRRRRIGSA
jgi:hypothetical protein